jgi:hypothetical protein
MPILIVVAVILLLAGLSVIFRLMGVPVELTGASSILPGLLAAILWVCFVNHVSLGQLRDGVLSKDMVPFLLLIFSIMIFKGVMSDSHAVGMIRDELVANQIPVLCIIMIMPFLSGFITGLAVGFVGTSFPLIIPLFQTLPSYDYMALAAVAYTFGYMGMMLSPVHLCFLVSKDYYGASLFKSYRHILLPTIAVMAGTAFIFIGMRAF